MFPQEKNVGKWIVSEKPKDVPKRNAIKLSKDTIHKVICEYGTRPLYRF